MLHAVHAPYLLFVGDTPADGFAKTATGLAHWRRDECVGTWRTIEHGVSIGLPDCSLDQAVARGARTVVVGVAPPGGALPAHWVASLRQALEAGLDLAAGLHTRLRDLPELVAAASANGRELHDVRYPKGLPQFIGTGLRRSGRRVLTVGTDCSSGKMYTALALERELRARHLPATFRATGQTGILIAGSGVAIDAVVADFISGAVELLAPANAAEHWDVIEGQGSLFHPSFAGVSLGLLHGAQPDLMVMCHDPSKPHMSGLPHQPLPDLATCIAANEAAARLTNPTARVCGIALNTSKLGAAAAQAEIERTADGCGLPVVDAVRTG
ncbi:MAG: DUF1611 domain-containing protein, partial [Planctomycetes bacterium]|nr:DUF1611 domain-containing protein [Planctomycetota bacterium]